MALSKDKKLAIVAEVTDLLAGSKLTVVANYRGTSVQRMQDLRRLAQKKHTKVRIVKNRLVKKAIEQSGLYKDAELGFLTGQLLYAFNSQDEAAAAQAREQLLEVRQRNPLAFGDVGQRHRALLVPQRQIEHGGYGITSFGCEFHEFIPIRLRDFILHTR